MLVTQYFASDLYRGKTVFVTGGGSGINLGVAKNFAALGANIANCGRTQAKLDHAAAELRALAELAAASRVPPGELDRLFAFYTGNGIDASGAYADTAHTRTSIGRHG